MRTALITGIGGDVAQGVATILRETYPDWRLLGADLHERHAGALFVDQFVLAPRACESGYDAWIADICRREAIDVCLPTSDAELIHLAGAARELPSVPFVTANPEAIRVGSDKLRTAQFLAGAGIPAPWTIPAEAFDERVEFPCILKARRSAGSKAVFICHSPADVEFYRERCPHAVLQQLLLPADREVTCAVFRARDRQTAVLQMLRTLVGGFTGWAHVIDDPEVAAQCRSLAEHLDLQGSINVQLRITEAGPRIFEINPRFSSTALIRHRLGFRDVVWSVQQAFGEPFQLEQPAAGLTAVRVQGAAILR